MAGIHLGFDQSFGRLVYYPTAYPDCANYRTRESHKAAQTPDTMPSLVDRLTHTEETAYIRGLIQVPKINHKNIPPQAVDSHYFQTILDVAAATGP